jgi:hypothetical protein
MDSERVDQVCMDAHQDRDHAEPDRGVYNLTHNPVNTIMGAPSVDEKTNCETKGNECIS